MRAEMHCKTLLDLDPERKETLDGLLRHGFFLSAPKRSEDGVVYLTEPGVSLERYTELGPTGYPAYIRGLNPAYEEAASDYEKNFVLGGETMAAGQLCYQSYTSGSRTPSSGHRRYVKKILDERHGSVLEHTYVSMLVYGISRSVSHEWVRHRAGWAYSQVSQRYVGPENLRFVANREIPLEDFLLVCRQSRKAYAQQIEKLRLAAEAAGNKVMRKEVQQAARNFLPNCTETAMYVTANLRAWRGFLDQRSNPRADSAIQEVAWRCAMLLFGLYPDHFQDYSWWAEKDSYGIMRVGVQTDNKKV